MVADGVTGGAPFHHHQDALAHARTHRVDGHNVAARRSSVGSDGSDQQHLAAHEGRMLGGGDDVADDVGDQHQAGSSSVTTSTMPTTPASAGTTSGRNAWAASRPL